MNKWGADLHWVCGADGGVRVGKDYGCYPLWKIFLFVTSSHSEALTARNVVDSLLTRLGLASNPKKGMWEPAQVIVHLGMKIDLARGVFRAPAEKLKGIRDLARAILGIAGRNQRWIPAKMLASLTGKAQFLYLAIPAARLY